MHDLFPVGTSSDLPGDPVELRRAATVVDDLAVDWGGLRDRLAEMAPEEVWAGLAVKTFAASRDDVAAAAKGMAQAGDGASEALAAWATRLEGLQLDALDARDDARRADEDIDAALAGVARMRAFAREQVEVAAGGGQPRAWSGWDWDAELADARRRREHAQDQFDGVVARHDRQARTTADDIDVAGADLAAVSMSGLGRWSRGLAGLSMIGRIDGLQFVRTSAGLVLNTPESWREQTYLAAGVDPASLDPSLGLEGMDGAPARLWEFYGQLYEDNPDEFLWAGMANLAGIQVHGGIEDLVQMRKLVDGGTMTPIEAIEALFKRQLPEGLEVAAELAVSGAAVALADVHADEFVDELRWTETKLLHMQKAIFDDLAWQHLAYANGGMPALEATADDDPGAVREIHLDAWAMVDNDNSEAALQKLADYEQNDILQPYYDEILARKPVPWAMTWAMTVTARSPTPSGGHFWEETWQAAHLDTPNEVTLWPEVLPGPRVAVDTPDDVTLYGVPGEMPPNIANQDDRWEWVRDHMAGQFLGDLESGQAQEWIAADLHDLAQQRRLIPDLPIIGVDD